MSEVQQQQRRWSGYVCPDCRAVFRVPQPHEGRGVVCPSCKRMLRLAAPGEETPPLVREISQPAEIPILEKPAPAPVDSRLGVGAWVAAGCGAVVAGGLVMFLLSRSLKDDPQVSMVKAPPEAVLPTKEPTPPQEAGISFGPEEQRLAGEAVEKFLNARSIDAASEVVYHPEVTRPRLDKAFPDGEFSAGAKSRVGDFEMPNPLVPLVSCSVQTDDYETKVLTIHLTSKGPKIDWEDWAGWSEMSWSDFRKEKRQTPVLFRVEVAMRAYYNFDFSDDNRWQNYQLQSADGYESLSAYVERGSQLDLRLSRHINDGSSKMTLLLKFPADAKSDKQVLIDKIVQTGWVEGE
ncbi:MAG: hypothetical protein QM680_11515 [Luteolibacter sp.]